MGHEQMLEKLNNVLLEEKYDEYKVIYILTRIRKFLEIRKIRTKYKILNFYCNWALHSKIDRVESVVDILQKYNNGDRKGFNSFAPLIKDLRFFLVAYNLPTEIIDNNDKLFDFINILLDIYSDTPLEFYPENKKILTIKRSKKLLKKDAVYGVDWEIK